MSTGNARPLQSFLAPQLRSYLEFMVAMGYSSFGNSFHRSLARDLDYYLLFWGVRSVREMDEGLVANWMHSNPKLAPVSKNHKLRFARGLFRHLMRLGLAEDNPAERIQYLRFAYPKPYLFTLLEIHQILEQAAACKRRHADSLLGWTLETLFFLIYACGLRISEALNLRLKDVDFEQNTLSLWRTKFHKERLLPFSPAAARRLAAYLAERNRRHPPASADESLFRSRAGRYHRSSIERHFKNIVARCGFKSPPRHGEPCIHGLRHAFALHRLYKWYQEGHDIRNKLPLLSTYMGHATVAATQVYLAMTLALLREGDRRFQAGFEAPAGRALRRALGRPS